MLKRTPKDLLAQADPEKDCVPPPVPEEDEEEHEAEWQAVSAQGTAGVEWPWSARPRIGGRAGLAQIEKIALGVESLVNRLIGADAETQHAASLLNPFYHTGTIAVFLLIVVAVTGLYLTVFYIAPGLGTNVAYESVSAIDRHLLWIGRIVRGVHRYASGAAAVATLFHAIRTLFQDRFRGARWLAWLTGMLLLAAMWFEGLTGYWLVWDQRAQLILETVIRAMTTFPSVGIPFALNFLTNQSTDQTWLLFLLLLFAHIALFTVIGLFYWFHVLRLSRAKFLPPRYFMIALGAILVVASVIVPAASALKADLGRLSGSLTIDPFFLFYLPATLRVNPAFFWSATSIAFGLVTAIPWVFRGKQPGKVVIDKNICTGCTKCAEDCPYNAIAMVPRTDGKPHKLIAMENPSLCVSCGICVGSCDGMAVSLTDLPATSYYQSVLARVRTARSAAGVPVKVVFTCERHGAHGAAKWRVTGGEWRDARHASLVTFTLPCVGVLHPNVVGQTLDAGAAEVLVVGCPGDDCAQREGNLWIDARLNRTRLPRLKKQYVGAAIRTALVPPNEFARALNPQPLISDRNAQQQEVFTLKPAHFIRGGILLALFLAFQVAITDVNYQPYSPSESLLQLGIRNDGQLRDQTKVLTGPELAQLSHDEQVKYLEEQQAEGRFPIRLRLEVDGKVVLDNSYRALGFRQEGSSFAYEKFLLPSGQHTVRLSADDAGGDLKPVIDRTTHFAPGQIHAITFDQVTKTFNLK
ncbi:MAG: cytochrome b N-terminal domain-containing protein [Chloroflexi bacterium]|nr:cytochrome b N-terminal domain-containing protein [Chloroflexota bacterium]